MSVRKTDTHIAELAKKWLEGTITEEEKHRFDDWYNSFDDTTIELLEGETSEQLRERLFKTILEKEKIRKPALARPVSRIITALAAAVLLFLLFGIYFSQDWQLFNKGTGQQISSQIRPGSNKAILTLQDGSEIVLDKMQPGSVLDLENISIHKSGDGLIVYQVKGGNSDLEDNIRIGYNTITTPRGGQFQVNLPDGTRVWLNAASSLTFPTAFTGSERKVTLTGEAYFEVAKKLKGNQANAGRLPFIVTSGGQQVEVLGTHFNINAYADEEAIRTTLLEGSVRVSNLNTSASGVLLKPGQQAANDKTIRIFDVDARRAIAWKEGYFSFENETIESIMRKISRWYDVDIDYKEQIRPQKFGGSISKFENIDQVLKIIELTGVIHFKVEGRRVIVMP